jgi:prepilin-type N-terminal cleavage/methylation domain-containing protein/prepilin-type processing-associated H-X9-DG protein
MRLVLPPPPRRGARRSAFTLVELLVVIGIIAVLIGILLPVLSGAREQAKTAQCLSNLRQIGQAFNLYAAENKQYLIPGHIRQQPKFGGRGEETWFTILAANRYVKGADQIDFRPATPDEALPGDNAWNAEGSAGNTIFRCPSGTDMIIPLGGNPPSPNAKTDDYNNWAWRRQSLLHAGVGASRGSAPIVDCWYGFNGINPSQADMRNDRGQDAFPMRVFGHFRSNSGRFRKGEIVGGPWVKLGKLRKAAELALIYDGFWNHNWNTNQISARHNRQRQTNFLFADGHAVTVDSKSLPLGGAGNNQATSDLRSPTELGRHPFPKWRLDQ